MRTTLDIDDDVLRAARELARHERTTAGRIISDLFRKGLQADLTASPSVERNGFEVIPANGRVITPELVHRLLEEGEA